jgi:hypothetical protein
MLYVAEYLTGFDEDIPLLSRLAEALAKHRRATCGVP